MVVNLKIGDTQDELIEEYAAAIKQIFDDVSGKRSLGWQMTGWIDWVNKNHDDIIAKAKSVRDEWKGRVIDVIVVVGTGGSYIGTRAALEFLGPLIHVGAFQFLYLPYFADRYVSEVLGYLRGRRFSVIVISKSGTTLETSVTFRLLRELLIQKEQDDYYYFVAVITDKYNGTLRAIANKEKFSDFCIETDIGGRYSTLTAVGLVPMLIAGVDVQRVLNGAKKAYEDNFNGTLGPNKAALYAAYRHNMFQNHGLTMECMIGYDPHMRFVLEMMKQLFAESDGKDEKGLMPVILDFTPDLHSVGQLIQDGKKSFFETTVRVNESGPGRVRITKSSFGNDDQLDWLVGKTLKDINDAAFEGTYEAHSDVAKVNNLVIELPDWSPETFGYFYYWLSLAAMFSAYLLKVNPFDQPGVEIYKKRTIDILKKK